MVRAVGIAMFMQRGYYPEFICPWCGAEAHPTSRSQRTCGKAGCSEKQGRAGRMKAEAKVKASRQKSRAAVVARGQTANE